MDRAPGSSLSRRERQIMDVIYRQGRATAAEVEAQLDDPPSYSAVRALLKILEAKGHLTHVREGRRHSYMPTVAREQAARGALRQLVRTFFGNSRVDVVAALLGRHEKVSAEELAEMKRLIANARPERDR